jgi:GTP-binding protein
MNITSAVFKRGVVDITQFAGDEMPHVALIGRSNVGKSSTINVLTGVKGLAKTSATPGRTRELNEFVINNKWKLIDLPGYGFASAAPGERAKMQRLISQYLFELEVHKVIVLIIDAFVGPTDADMEMLQLLEQSGAEIIVIANKVDKLKKSTAQAQLKKIQAQIGAHTFVPYSAEKKIGIGQVLLAIESALK